MKSEATISKNGRSSERRRADQAVDAKPAAARRAAKAPPAAAGLPAIPRVGPVRIQALAAAGITTLEQLRAMSVEQIGAVKWVGIGNARLIRHTNQAHIETSTAAHR